MENYLIFAGKSISIRHYLFPEDGSLRRVPQRIVAVLPFGADAIPEFAATRQRAAFVVLELRDAKPLRILDARGSYWEFDDKGRVDEHLRQAVADRIDLMAAPRPKGPVVDLVPELKLRERVDRNTWTLTAADLDRIAADLWPGIHGPAPEVTTVKGRAPRKPQITYEAKSALADMAQHVNAITIAMGGLSERVLKGLAFESQRMGSVDDECIWRGVAEEARRCEAIQAAHRTGRGEWYAVVEVTRMDTERPFVGEQLAIAREKCRTRRRRSGPGAGSWPRRSSGSARGRSSRSRCARRWSGGRRYGSRLTSVDLFDLLSRHHLVNHEVDVL